jgi:hypothetical protein
MHIVDHPAYTARKPPLMQKPNQKNAFAKSKPMCVCVSKRERQIPGIMYAKKTVSYSASDFQVDSVRKAPRGRQALSTYS